MGFRFRKSFKILPGVKINVGKTGISTSVGTRGAHVTVGKNGARASVGIPGTGLSYSQKISDGTPLAAQEEQTCTRSEIDHDAQIKENIEQIQQSYKRGKNLYTWDNIKTLLLHVIALPSLAFLVVGMAISPFVGLFAMGGVAGMGIRKFLKKTKDI